ncbi:MAG: ORF6N domain-containing protein [Burkholderiales bacterium]
MPAQSRRAALTGLPPRGIESRILLVRGQKVLIDADLAKLYGVPTKRLNEQVKRNGARFPEDFCFQLSPAEKEEVVANCDHLARLKFSPVLPYAFTEHGAIMAANVLNSPRAVDMSVHVVRAFVRLREMIASHKELAKRLDELEARYDRQFKAVFDAIRELMVPVEPRTRRKIGFV